MFQANDPIGVQLVVAMGRRREIGRNGALLFRLKSDMANFRKATAKKPLIMGRKTWDSFPKRPLPGRPNLIVTRNRDFLAPDARVLSGVVPALAAARAMAAQMGADEVAVIGGSEIYAAALPLATSMLITEVDAEADADAYFPDFDRNEWREVSAVRFEKDADNEAAFVVRDLRRK